MLMKVFASVVGAGSVPSPSSSGSSAPPDELEGNVYGLRIEI